jgi:hypothetical protein
VEYLEGETLRVLGQSEPFVVTVQQMAPFAPRGKWSGEAQLMGRSVKAGTWVDLAVPVPRAGRHRLAAWLTRGNDYGVIRFRVNGKLLGKPFDGYEGKTVVSRALHELGVADLPAGEVTLRVEVVGTNPRSVRERYFWGLDALELESVLP